MDEKRVLPKINLPVFEARMPISGKNISFRYWTIKEAKILAMALQALKQAEQTKSGITASDYKDTYISIRQICNNCIIDDINVNLLPLADVEYLFVQIRGQSKGRTVNITLNSDENENVVTELQLTKGNETKKITINLMDIKVIPLAKTDKKIDITEGSYLNLKDATFGDFIESYDFPEESYPRDFLVSIDSLIHNNEVWNFSDYNISDVSTFLDSLPADIIFNLREYYDKIPRIKYEIDLQGVFGVEDKIILRGLIDFFD